MKRSLSLCLLVILWSPLLWAQVTISGKIISSANEDLRGVSILLKGNTRGAQTDEQGRFTLVVPQLPAAILISNIGFETREIYLKTRDAGTITLELSTAQVDPIVMAPTRRPGRSLE